MKEWIRYLLHKYRWIQIVPVTETQTGRGIPIAIAVRVQWFFLRFHIIYRKREAHALWRDIRDQTNRIHF